MKDKMGNYITTFLGWYAVPTYFFIYYGFVGEQRLDLFFLGFWGLLMALMLFVMYNESKSRITELEKQNKTLEKRIRKMEVKRK